MLTTYKEKNITFLFLYEFIPVNILLSGSMADIYFVHLNIILKSRRN